MMCIHKHLQTSFLPCHKLSTTSGREEERELDENCISIVIKLSFNNFAQSTTTRNNDKGIKTDYYFHIFLLFIHFFLSPVCDWCSLFFIKNLSVPQIHGMMMIKKRRNIFYAFATRAMLLKKNFIHQIW